MAWARGSAAQALSSSSVTPGNWVQRSPKVTPTVAACESVITAMEDAVEEMPELGEQGGGEGGRGLKEKDKYPGF